MGSKDSNSPAFRLWNSTMQHARRQIPLLHGRFTRMLCCHAFSCLTEKSFKKTDVHLFSHEFWVSHHPVTSLEASKKLELSGATQLLLVFPIKLQFSLIFLQGQRSSIIQHLVGFQYWAVAVCAASKLLTQSKTEVRQSLSTWQRTCAWRSRRLISARLIQRTLEIINWSYKRVVGQLSNHYTFLYTVKYIYICICTLSPKTRGIPRVWVLEFSRFSQITPANMYNMYMIIYMHIYVATKEIKREFDDEVISNFSNIKGARTDRRLLTSWQAQQVQLNGVKNNGIHPQCQQRKDCDYGFVLASDCLWQAITRIQEYSIMHNM